MIHNDIIYPQQAKRILKKLLLGTPPDWRDIHYIDVKTPSSSYFYDKIDNLLDGKSIWRNFFLFGNIGSGKSHYLTNIQRKALLSKSIVIRFELNGKQRIKLNLFDTILEQIIVNFTYLGDRGEEKGLFDILDEYYVYLKPERTRKLRMKEISDKFRSILLIKLIFSWFYYKQIGNQEQLDEIKELISSFSESTRRRKRELKSLLEGKSGKILSQWYIKDLFPYYDHWDFSGYDAISQNYRECWYFIKDLKQFSKLTDSKRIIIIIDECEEVFSGYRNHVRKALKNLRKMIKSIYDIPSYCALYAITPDFYVKLCNFPKDPSIDNKVIIELQSIVKDDSTDLNIDLLSNREKVNLLTKLITIIKATGRIETELFRESISNLLQQENYFPYCTARQFIKNVIDNYYAI